MKIVIIYYVISLICEIIYLLYTFIKLRRDRKEDFKDMMRHFKKVMEAFFPASYVIVVCTFFVACPFVFPVHIYSNIKKKIFPKPFPKVSEKKSSTEENPVPLASLDHRVDRLYGELHPCNIKHVALYAKLHYERTNDIWADVEKCLIADTYTPTSREEILRIVIRNTAGLFYKSYNNDVGYYTNEFVEALNPHYCWRYGFYHNEYKWVADHEKLTAYDYQTAVLWFFLSRLQGATVLELGGLPKANHEVLPLRKK